MHRAKVLLVEDDPNDEALTLLAIKESGINADIVVVHDGEEALDLLLGNGTTFFSGALPQLVLLDLKLPKIDGHEVLRTLRANEATRRLPVVVFTSSAEEADLLNSYGHGANSYVQK